MLGAAALGVGLWLWLRTGVGGPAGGGGGEPADLGGKAAGEGGAGVSPALERRPGGGAEEPLVPRVRVVDGGRGTGVGGARLCVVPADAGHAVRAGDAVVLTADEQGGLAVARKGWAKDRIWIVSAPGYRTVSTAPAVLLGGAVGEVATVALWPGARVSGRVVTPWGAGVAGAEVVGYGRHGADFDGSEAHLVPGPGRGAQVFRARTDATGAFELAGIEEFPVRVAASKPGHAWKTDPEQEALFVGAETDDLRLVLRPRLGAGIRVVDGETGELVRDFEVRTEGLVGPATGGGEASEMRPGSVSDLGFAWRAGQWWVTACYADQATGPTDPVSAVARVRAPGYGEVAGVRLALAVLGPEGAPEPVTVALAPARAEPPGRLWVRVVSTVAEVRLPWANVRVVEEVEPDAEEGAAPLDWTFRVELDAQGRARRPIALRAGTYRVRVAPGTGWATWAPPSAEPWAPVRVWGHGAEGEVTLAYRAALLRVVVTQTSGGPVGLFNLMVHDVTPPERGVQRVVAPLVAVLFEEEERWWLGYGHPYRAHLRMEPGAMDLLVAPGRYHVKVTKTGFRDPVAQTVDLAEGEVVSVALGLAPKAPAGR